MDDGLGLGHGFGLLRHQRLHRSLILVEVDSRLVFSGGTTLGIAAFSRHATHRRVFLTSRQSRVSSVSSGYPDRFQTKGGAFTHVLVVREASKSTMIYITST